MSFFDEDLNCFVPHTIGDLVSTPYGTGILTQVKRESDGKSEILFEWGTVIMHFGPQAKYLGAGRYAISLFRKDMEKIWTHMITDEYLVDVCESDKRTPKGIDELSSVKLSDYYPTPHDNVYYIRLMPHHWAEIYRNSKPYAIQLSSKIEAQRVSDVLRNAKEKFTSDISSTAYE